MWACVLLVSRKPTASQRPSIHLNEQRLSFALLTSCPPTRAETIVTKRAPTGLPIPAHYISTKFNKEEFVHPIRFVFTA